MTRVKPPIPGVLSFKEDLTTVAGPTECSFLLASY